MQKIPKEFLFSIILIFVCISRLIPHPYNFSPIGSIFLMSPILFKNKYWSFTVSIIPLFISDVLINKFIYNSNNIIYDGFMWIYLSYIFIWLYSLKTIKYENIFLKSIISSLIFFFITNAMCWYGNVTYAQNITGLFESYIAGIPFYWNTLAGFIFYSAIIHYVSKFLNKSFYSYNVTKI